MNIDRSVSHTGIVRDCDPKYVRFANVAGRVKLFNRSMAGDDPEITKAITTACHVHHRY